MDEEQGNGIWVLGFVMYEMDVEVFNVSGEMIPLVNLFLLLSPVVFVRPDLVQVGRPFCGEAVFGACALDDILCRNSGILDLAIIALDFGVGDADLEWTNFG